MINKTTNGIIIRIFGTIIAMKYIIIKKKWKQLQLKANI